jgi:predicted nucleic acid-binding protein
MGSSPICIDANLIIRLVVDVNDLLIQNQWQQWAEQKQQIVAPSLLWYEVTNALYQYHKHGILDDVTLKDAHQTVLSLPVQLFGEALLHQQALALTQQFTLPATYDAHYLALADRLNAEFWTSDRKLITAVSPIFPRIHLWPPAPPQ